MKNAQTHAVAALRHHPDPLNGLKEALGDSPFVNVDPDDARAKWEELLGEELVALLADLPIPAQNEKCVAALADKSTSEDHEERAPLPADEAPVKSPTFEPTTKMEAGKARWNRGIRFVAIPHALLTHEGFAKLSGRASKLLLAIASQYIGSNNGHLTATFSRMKRFGFNSKDSLAKSIRELIMSGLIVRTRSQQRRMPARYALTWLPINKALTGEPYDSGVEPEDQSSDLWRESICRR